MPKANVREDEWLEELRRISTLNTKGFTTSELADRLRISLPVAATKMRAWHRASLIVHAGYRDGQSMDGKRTKVPVYNLTSKGKK